MPAVTQDRETQKKIISEYLKAADRYIKSSEFPKALDEVNKALGVEPNNMYATAYNERIKVAMEAARKKEEEERFKKQVEEQKKVAPAETAVRAPNAPDAKPQSLPAQTPPPASAAQLPGDDMITKIKKEASEAAEKKTDARVDLLKQEFTASQQKFHEDIARLTAQLKDQTIVLLGKLFLKAWEDGVISPDEQGLLTIVKNEGGLSDEEFTKMENESGASSYITHLREVWKDGAVTPEEAEALEALRKTLNISAETHFKLEAQVRKEMQPKK